MIVKPVPEFSQEVHPSLHRARSLLLPHVAVVVRDQHLGGVGFQTSVADKWGQH